MTSSQNNAEQTNSARRLIIPIKILDLVNWVDQLANARILISATGHLSQVKGCVTNDEIEHCSSLAEDEVAGVVSEIEDLINKHLELGQ